MKTNLHNILGADPILSEEGVWVDICLGIRVKIASSESQRYKAAMRAAMLAHVKFDGKKSKLSKKIASKVLFEAMANGMLLDWEGITDDNDKEVPYSLNQAKKLLADPDLAIFVDRVIDASKSLANFRSEQIADAEKN